MREDHLEQLEAMFPRGYVITYIMPNNEPAYQWFNPKMDEFIIGYLKMLDEVLIKEGEDDDDLPNRMA